MFELEKSQHETRRKSSFFRTRDAIKLQDVSDENLVIKWKFRGALFSNVRKTHYCITSASF